MEHGQPPAHAAAMLAMIEVRPVRPKKTWDILASARARALLQTHPESDATLERRGIAGRKTLAGLRAGGDVQENRALRICKALVEASNATPV